MNLTTHPHRESWLLARQCSLGGSLVPQVLGLRPSALEAYCKLRGLMPSVEDNYVLKRGRTLEAGVIELLAEEASVAIEHTPLSIATNAAWPGCHYSPDGISWSKAAIEKAESEADKNTFRGLRQTVSVRSDALVEIKTTWDRRAWKDGPPLHVEAQARFGMAIMDMPRALVGVFFDLRSPPDWCCLERDLTWEEFVRPRIEAFLARVERGDPPPPDGSDSAGEALAALYPEAARGKRVELGDEFLNLHRGLGDVNAEIKRLGDLRDERRQLLRAAIGDAEWGDLPDGSAYSLRTVERKGYTVEPTTYRELRHVPAKRGRK